MHGPDDTGQSDLDNVTQVNKPRIAGLAEADCDIRLYEGSTQIGAATSDGVGGFVAQITPVLSEGQHSITATAVKTGILRKSLPSAPVVITIDTRRPTGNHSMDAGMVTLCGQHAGGSGVSDIQYCINAQVWETYAGPFATQPGDAVEYYAVDLAGNCEDPKRLFHRPRGDLSGDGFVGQADLDIVLGQWGRSGSGITDPRADANHDDFVGQGDLDIVLANWGKGVRP